MTIRTALSHVLKVVKVLKVVFVPLMRFVIYVTKTFKQTLIRKENFMNIEGHGIGIGGGNSDPVFQEIVSYTPFIDEITVQAAKINTDLEGDALKLYTQYKDRFNEMKGTYTDMFKRCGKAGAVAGIIAGIVAGGIFSVLAYGGLSSGVSLLFDANHSISLNKKLDFIKMFLKVNPKATENDLLAALEKRCQESEVLKDLEYLGAPY